MWFFNDGTKTHGPFTPEVMRELLGKGTISGETLVSLNGHDGWLPVHQVVERTKSEETPPALPNAAARTPLAQATAPSPAKSVKSGSISTKAKLALGGFGCIGISVFGLIIVLVIIFVFASSAPKQMVDVQSAADSGVATTPGGFPYPDEANRDTNKSPIKSTDVVYNMSAQCSEEVNTTLNNIKNVDNYQKNATQHILDLNSNRINMQAACANDYRNIQNISSAAAAESLILNTNASANLALGICIHNINKTNPNTELKDKEHQALISAREDFTYILTNADIEHTKVFARTMLEKINEVERD